MKLDLSLLPYKSLECQNQEIIASKVLKYLQTKTDLLDGNLHPLWNKINTVDLLKAVPEIYEYFKELGLRVREISFTLCTVPDDVHLHIDEKPVVAKINFPILNNAGTINEWYNIPQEILDQAKPTVNHFGSEFYHLGDIDLAQCTKIGEVEMTHPIVFNSSLPHKVRMTKQSKLPRLVMASTFFDEPVDLLR